jgi:hypothetical protein
MRITPEPRLRLNGIAAERRADHAVAVIATPCAVLLPGPGGKR